MYQSTAIGATCKIFYNTISIVSAADITTIVKYANSLRRFVALGYEDQGNVGPQPGAKNMRQLVFRMSLFIAFIY